MKHDKIPLDARGERASDEKKASENLNHSIHYWQKPEIKIHTGEESPRSMPLHTHRHFAKWRVSLCVYIARNHLRYYTVLRVLSLPLAYIYRYRCIYGSWLQQLRGALVLSRWSITSRKLSISYDGKRRVERDDIALEEKRSAAPRRVARGLRMNEGWRWKEKKRGGSGWGGLECAADGRYMDASVVRKSARALVIADVYRPT